VVLDARAETVRAATPDGSGNVTGEMLHLWLNRLGHRRFCNSGWSFIYGMGTLASGQHTLAAVAYDSQGASTQLQGKTNLTSNSDTAPFGWLDTPTSITAAQNTSFRGSGWAADKGDGSPVAKVQIVLDGTTVVGNAHWDCRARTSPTLSPIGVTPISGWNFTYNVGTLATGHRTGHARRHGLRLARSQYTGAGHNELHGRNVPMRPHRGDLK
jgi:hypothetical protein